MGNTLRESKNQLLRHVSPQFLSWSAAMFVVVVAVVVITSLDRFTEWDEAVFYSQSGGYRGTQPPPIALKPSVEGGPGFLTAVIRLTGVGLVGVRVGWVVAALLLAGVAFGVLGRHYDRYTGEASLVVFGLSWLSLAYLGSIYGNLVAGLFLVLAVGLLLNLVESAPRSRRSAMLGAWLGLAIAGAFWMRHAESIIGLTVLILFSIVMRRALIWRLHARAIGAAIGTFTVTFVLPWVVWSSIEFGSPVGRIDAIAAQSLANYPSGTARTAGLVAYLHALVGTFRRWGLYGSVPTWPTVILIVLGVGVVAALGWAVSRNGRQHRPIANWGIAILTALAITEFSMFAFWYAAVEVRERYMPLVAAFVAALVGIALLSIGTRAWNGRFRWLGISTIGAVAIIWVVAQIAIAVPYQRARVVEANEVVSSGTAIRVLAQEQPCVGVTRYWSVQLQLASGCAFRFAVSPEQLAPIVAAYEERGGPAFILWSTGTDWEFELDPRWHAVERPNSGMVLFYLAPDAP